MSITDELRKWGRATMADTSLLVRMEAIAYRIDAEHEKAMSRAGQLLADAEKDRDCNYANWQDCKQKVLQHNITMGELSAEIERLEDELAHCIELPKDADGEYIHIGDKLIDEDDKLQKPAIVKCILYNDEGCVVSDIDPRGCWYDPSLLRHYHAPTVEDLLREFAYGLGVPVADSYVAATAAKLRLAEGEGA